MHEVPGMASVLQQEHPHNHEELLQALRDCVDVPGMASVLQQEHPHNHEELGEGAYLDSEAVLQRTTSENVDCEDGHWEDCYKSSGDYLDYEHPKPQKAQDTLVPPPTIAIKSGACANSVVGLLVAAFAAA